jgi:tripartite-type tricarboxylate transporter receptor subunit TctC
MWKRFICAAILLPLAGSIGAATDTADAYPSKPIRIIDGFAPGGVADYMARVIGPKLGDRLGQPVIIENRPGAGGNIGAQFVARSNPDGYTLLLGSVTALASSPSLYPALNYDLLKDFSYVSKVGTAANVLVAHPSMPAKSIPELVALARSKPKGLNYSSAGEGSPGHLFMAQLQLLSGMELVHVPYKGGAPAIAALLAGDVQLSFSSITATIGMIQANRLHALAVSGAKRSAALPDVPTVVESGVPGFTAPNAFGIFAPAGTPPAVVERLNAELGAILQMDEIKSKFTAQGFEAAGSTPDEFKAVVQSETALWTRVVKDAHISQN